MDTSIIKYSVSDAAISKMNKEYMPLIVLNLDDQAGFALVHQARMEVKGHRIDVEKKRKELKVEALAWGRAVDSEAKRIFALLEPIETHLQSQEDKITKEKERIKAEADRIEKEKIQARIDELMKYHVILPFIEVATWTDEEFTAILSNAAGKYKDEQARLAQEEADRKAESERLEKIAKEQEAEATRLQKIQEDQEAEQEKKEAELRAKEKALQSERDKIETEKRLEKERLDRVAFEKQAKIQAEKDAKAKAEREAREKKEREEAEAIEKARQDALRPDKDKIIAWANSLQEIMAPPVESERAQEILADAVGEITTISMDVKKQAEEM